MASAIDKGSSGVGGVNQIKDDNTVPTLNTAQSDFSSSLALASAIDSITGTYSNINDKYIINYNNVIGIGCFAKVYECTNRTTNKIYAVKSIEKNYNTTINPDHLIREVELLKEINHPNIIKLIDIYEDIDYLHIVTERLMGDELYDRIRIKKKLVEDGIGCFPEDEAAAIIRQVLCALLYLHEHDICHRDIKPENIMFETDKDGSPVKLIDFGVARKHYKDSLEKYMSTTVGTSFFIAPEVLNEKYDKTCDLWSLGVTAFVMLCGYPPFQGRSNREVCLNVKRGKYSFNSKHWQGVSKEAQDFVRRLLQVNVKKRMSVEKALKHPWIVKHTNSVKEEDDKSMSSTTLRTESDFIKIELLKLSL